MDEISQVHIAQAGMRHELSVSPDQTSELTRRSRSLSCPVLAKFRFSRILTTSWALFSECISSDARHHSQRPRKLLLRSRPHRSGPIRPSPVDAQ